VVTTPPPEMPVEELLGIGDRPEVQIRIGTLLSDFRSETATAILAQEDSASSGIVPVEGGKRPADERVVVEVEEAFAQFRDAVEPAFQGLGIEQGEVIFGDELAVVHHPDPVGVAVGEAGALAESGDHQEPSQPGAEAQGGEEAVFDLADVPEARPGKGRAVARVVVAAPPPAFGLETGGVAVDPQPHAVDRPGLRGGPGRSPGPPAEQPPGLGAAIEESG